MTKVKFGYWHIRGLAQTPRLLAAYTGMELDETRYTDREQWTNQDKENLGLDFPNLPYLIDGDFKLTESGAIQRYIIMKSGHDELLGKNAKDRARVDSLLGTLKDSLKQIRGLFWNKEYESLKEEALKKATAKFDDLQRFIGDNKFAIGYLTLADFEIAQFSFYVETLYRKDYMRWSFWETIRENFHALPQIDAYYKSENALSEPFLPSQMAVLNPKFRETLVLGYWGVRGLAQHIRLMLQYVNLPFEEKIYTSRQEWFEQDKQSINTPFPNIPYLKDGEFVITESNAIERYVARRSNNPQLLGKNIQDSAKVESIYGVHGDVLTEIQKNFWKKDEEQIKKTSEAIDNKLTLLGKFIGERDSFLEYLTFVDFLWAERSHYIESFLPEVYKKHEFLHRIRKHIDGLESSKAYYAREGCLKGPFMPPHSQIQPSHEEYA